MQISRFKARLSWLLILGGAQAFASWPAEAQETLGTYRLTFSQVSEVQTIANAQTGTGPEVTFQLALRAPDAALATVGGSPGLPAQTKRLTVHVLDTSPFFERNRDQVRRCERLGLIAQARPERYRLVTTVDAFPSNVLQVDENAVVIRLEEGKLECRLIVD